MREVTTEEKVKRKQSLQLLQRGEGLRCLSSQGDGHAEPRACTGPVSELHLTREST